MAGRRELRIDEGASSSQENCDNRNDCAKKHQRKPLLETIKLFDGSFWDEMLLYYHFHYTLQMYKYNQIQEANVRQVHQNYLIAGANVIRTSTTGAFFSKMKEYDQQLTEENYSKLVTMAVEIANDVVIEHNKKSNISWKQATVVGSCGHFEPTAEMTRDEIKNEYRRLMKTLSTAGINTFCLQDIQNSQDARMLVELLRELRNEKTSAFMMFRPDHKGFLNDGNDFIDTVIHCHNEIPLTAVGINGLYPADAYALFEKLQEKQNLQKDIPLMVCSNKPILASVWEPIHLPSKFPAPPIQWAQFGIRYIGGWYGVCAEDIKCIREELKPYDGTSK